LAPAAELFTIAAMGTSVHQCCVCPSADDLTGVVVAGQNLLLCGNHRRKLGDRQPESFDDLAAFFGTLGADRRRTVGDRRREERRMFPPRPELRRYGMGRRKGDPDV
jgi:hypothetical protein